MDATRLLPSATAYATPMVAGTAVLWGGWSLGGRALVASLVMVLVSALGAHAARRFVWAAQHGAHREARIVLMGRHALMLGTGLGLVALLGAEAAAFGVGAFVLASGIVAGVGALQSLPGRATARALEMAC